MNKILIPVDFSEASINAIEFAVEIGSRFSAIITLLHVFTEEDFNKVLGEEKNNKSFKELMSMAKAKLKSLSDTVTESANKKGLQDCNYYLELGELSERLNAIIEEEHYDLVVMGTTGLNHSTDIFFGSNTERVIDDVRVPILCVPVTASFEIFKKIVYASDFLKEDRRAIQDIISFAIVFDARINVLHINQGESDQYYNDFVTDLKSFIQYDKISFVSRHYAEGIGDGINAYMKEEDSDLLVVYKRKRSFVGSIFHKSLTQILSYSTNKPLLILKLEE